MKNKRKFLVCSCLTYAALCSVNVFSVTLEEAIGDDFIDGDVNVAENMKFFERNITNYAVGNSVISICQEDFLASQLTSDVSNTIFSRLNTKPETKFNLWTSVIGDFSRSSRKKTENVKLSSNLWGVLIGADLNINENWTLGIFGGFSKGKTKSTEDLISRTRLGANHKVYYGGIYGAWTNLADTLKINAQIYGGRMKSRLKFNTLEYPNVTIVDNTRYDYNVEIEACKNESNSHKHNSHVFGAGLEITYTPWNVRGINMGPWIAMNYTHKKTKARKIKFCDDKLQSGMSHDGKQMYLTTDKNKRNMFDIIIGLAAEYETGVNKFNLNLGYLRTLKNSNKGIDVTLSTAQYDLNNDELNAPEVKTTKEKNLFGNYYDKNKFVARASYNGNFGQFGLAAHLGTTLGKKNKNFSGSLTASYAF